MSGFINKSGSLEEFKVSLKKLKERFLVKVLYKRNLSDQSVVRVHPETMTNFGCFRGDIVRIFGKYGKETVLIILVNNKCEKNTAYVGGDIVPRNLGISEGDSCYMKQEEESVSYGNRILILPLKESICSDYKEKEIFVDFVNPFFLEAYRPVTRNNLIELAGRGKEKDKIIFSVVSTTPSDSVIVEPQTIIDFEGEPVDWNEPNGGVYYNKKLSYHQTRKIKKIRKTIDLVIRYPKVFKKINMKCPNSMLISSPSLDLLKKIERTISDQSGVWTKVIQPNEIKGKSYLKEIFKQAENCKTSTITIFHGIEMFSSAENKGKEFKNFMISKLEEFAHEEFLKNEKKDFNKFNLENLEKELKDVTFDFSVDSEAGYGGIYLEEIEKEEDTSPFGRGDLVSTVVHDFIIFTTTQPRSSIDPEIFKKVDVFVDVNDPLEESDFFERMKYLFSQVIHEEEGLFFDTGDEEKRGILCKIQARNFTFSKIPKSLLL